MTATSSWTPPLFSSLSLNIRTMGAVYGKPGKPASSHPRKHWYEVCLRENRSNAVLAGTVARRISIHRATTVGPKSPLFQVILKNTSVEKEASTAASKSSINRSQSLLTTNNRIPVLAPSRADRARLEAALSDVWTREVLPFPGMTVRARSEHLVRSSASSVMRKLSVASITSSFTKRSSSLASVNKTGSSDEPMGTVPECPRAAPRARREGATAETVFDGDEENTQPRLLDEGRGGWKGATAMQSHQDDTEMVMGAVRRLETLRLESDRTPGRTGVSAMSRGWPSSVDAQPPGETAG